jgi:lysyl-tRNA synthetase, class II
MDVAEFTDIVEQNDQTAARREHLEELQKLVGNVYPNKFERSALSGAEDSITNLLGHDGVATVVSEIKEVVSKLAERERPPAEIKDALNARLKEFGNVRVSGRLTTPPRGNFVHLTDGINKLQIYCKKGTFSLIRNDADNSVDEENGWEAFGLLDHGDFVGVEGYLFVTNTGELSVHVEKLQFLAKALVPMPDKMHGIADAEIKQRQRYVDLIGSSLAVEHEGLTTREVFEMRARTVSSLRRFLEDHGYIEVETPMLTPKATGAAAKPFKTHHNALDIDLYARIAPELYLKRLVVGGFEKVYELNRNFRNEGISYKHNPEFTMLEFYCSYMDVSGMMDFCEELLRQSVQNSTGGLTVEYEGNMIDFSRFERISMRDAIEKYAPGVEVRDNEVITAFDAHVEDKLIQPTFIVDFPKSISPLSKASPENPAVAERFELFINRMEVANGFSELNDPQEQYERFVDQMAERERGDEEAMVLDEDYIRALSYGMPPAAGIGIGIDRLVMLLTNKHSIRDVILFPHMRPEKKSTTEDTESSE